MEIETTRQKLVAGLSNEPPPAPGSKTTNKQPELDPALYGPPKGSGLAAFAAAQSKPPNESCEALVKETAKTIGDKAGAPIGAAMGAAIGAKAGPKGAAIGGVVGGILGASFGKAAGEIAGKHAAKVICPPAGSPPPPSVPASAPEPAPDAGGPVIQQAPATPTPASSANSSTAPAGEPSFTSVDPSKNKSG